MWLEDLLYVLPWWVFILIAFVPPMVVALGMRGWADHADPGKSATTIRTTLLSLASTALVFSVSFSTNTLWSQDTAIAAAARQSNIATSALLDELDDGSDDASVAEVADLLDRYEAEVQLADLRLTPVSGVPSVNALVDEIEAAVDRAADGSTEPDRIRAAEADFEKARATLLDELNAPGIPDVIAVMIVLMGMFVAGLYSTFPRGAQSRFSDFAVAGVVFIVGLIQLPLWVLNSSWMTLAMVTPYFGDAANSPGESLTGQVMAVLTMLGVLAALYLFFVRPNLLRRRQVTDEPEPQPDPLVQMQQTLDEIRDLLAAQAHRRLAAEDPPDARAEDGVDAHE